MFSSFVRPSIQLTIFIATFIVYAFLGWKVVLAYLLIVSIVLIFLRRKKIFLSDELRGKVGVILSPVYGEVRAIGGNINDSFFGENQTMIEIVVPLTCEGGMRLPFNSEILDKRSEKQKIHFRYGNLNKRSLELKEVKPGGQLLKLEGPYKVSVGLRVLKCILSARPRIWVKAGDKGKMGAVFGHLPFGGTVVLYFSSSYKVLVRPGEILRSGETPIAISR